MHGQKCTKHARKPGTISKNLQKRCTAKTKQKKQKNHTHTHTQSLEFETHIPDIKKCLICLKK